MPYQINQPCNEQHLTGSLSGSTQAGGRSAAGIPENIPKNMPISCTAVCQQIGRVPGRQDQLPRWSIQAMHTVIDSHKVALFTCQVHQAELAPGAGAVWQEAFHGQQDQAVRAAALRVCACGTDLPVCNALAHQRDQLCLCLHWHLWNQMRQASEVTTRV